MGPLFDNPPFVQHKDTIGMLDGGESVGDDERRPSASGARQRRLDKLLRSRIERRRGLVKYQNPRIAQQRSRNANSLTLALRKVDAALAHVRVQSLGQAFDELPGIRRARRCNDLRVGRSFQPKRDVVVDRASEEEGVLKDKPDVRSDVRELQVPQIVPVEQLGRALGRRSERAGWSLWSCLPHSRQPGQSFLPVGR